MFRGIYSATSAMLVQEKVLDVVGNNLANVDTSGFRSRVAVMQSFPEVLMDRAERYTVVDEKLREELEDESFAKFRGYTPLGTIPLANVMSETHMSLRPGVVRETDNPLDVTIGGEGFFVVEDGLGNTFYTRSGQFQKSPDGQLVTHEGEFVLGDGGRIEIGEATEILIDETGQVMADREVIAQLQVVTFENPTYLRHEKHSLLSETPDSGTPEAIEAPRVLGGVLERSNVEVVVEMVRMIEANRAYEGAARAVTIQDEVGGKLFTSVGKPA